LPDPGLPPGAARGPSPFSFRPAAHQSTQALADGNNRAGLADINGAGVIGRSNDHAAERVSPSIRSGKLNNAVLPCQRIWVVATHIATLTETPPAPAAQCGWNHGWRQRGCRGRPAGFSKMTRLQSLDRLGHACRAPLPQSTASGSGVKGVEDQLGAQQFNALHRLNQLPSL